MEKKEIREEINRLAGVYSLGGRSERILKGTGKDNKYSYIFWWRIEFSKEISDCLKDAYSDYEGIHFMPYFVGQDLLNEINRLNDKDILPDIDLDSGNLHPKAGEWMESPSVQQVVLVKSHGRNKGKKTTWGPLKGKNLPEGKIISFSDIADSGCYYPRTDSTPSGNASAEELLKGLLIEVLDKEKVAKEFGRECTLYRLLEGNI